MGASQTDGQLTTPIGHDRTRPVRVLLAVAVMSLVVWPLVLLNVFGSASPHVADVLQTATAFTLLGVMWRRVAEWPDRVGTISIAAMLAWCATDTTWTIASMLGRRRAGWVDVGYAAAVLLLAVSVGYRTWVTSQFASAARMVVDTAIVAGSTVLIWRVLRADTAPGSMPTTVGVLITIADAALLTMAAVRMHATRYYPSSVAAGVAAVLLVTTDLGRFVWLAGAHGSVDPGIFDLGRQVFLLLVGISVLLARPSIGPSAPESSMFRLQQLLPLTAVCAAASVLVLSPDVARVSGTRAGAVCLFVAFALRQVLVAWEGAGLRARAEHATVALAREARHDSLTGLFRRHVLVDLAAEALEQRRADGGRLAMLFVDIDGFRVINDRLGHHVGDEILRQVADRIASCCEPGDVPARMGGDEFVVLRPRADGDTAGWSEQARNVLSAPVGIAALSMQVRVNASIGVVHADSSYDDVGVLMADADLAMMRAKKACRANVQSFSISKRRGAEVTTVAALREGLGNGAVRLDYQPVVDLASGAIVGAEALVRWEHPQLGTLQPAEFLSLTEAAGLMSELGDVVMRTAVRDFSEGPIRDARWWVSVNLSPGELSDPGLVDRVRSSLGCLEPSRLMIEVQERTVPGPQVARRLNQVVDLGVRLAIDDFGSAPSSFGQLSDLPLHIVKLDRSLMPSAASNRSSLDRMSLAHALVALAHSRGLGVVAEGIEQVCEFQTMREIGCEMGQGYLWYRPARIEALREWALATPSPVPN